MKSKNIVFVILVNLSLLSIAMAEISQRDIWIQDDDYINGIMYLKGEKGFTSIQKVLDNCPYDKCKKSEISTMDLQNITKYTIKVPDFNKAISLLSKSAFNGNLLSREALLEFLLSRTNYKSPVMNNYLEGLLKKDTGLYKKEYIRLVTNLIKSMPIERSCYGNYIAATFLENGYLGFNKDLKSSKARYLMAYNTCASGNMYKMLSKGK